eukprot:scaffold19186_cov117-Isochrysis_galbana.AAC.3
MLRRSARTAVRTEMGRISSGGSGSRAAVGGRMVAAEASVVCVGRGSAGSSTRGCNGSAAEPCLCQYRRPGAAGAVRGRERGRRGQRPSRGRCAVRRRTDRSRPTRVAAVPSGEPGSPSLNRSTKR